jgi:hypothetical protein
MSDSYLLDAGWLFFAVLSVIVLVVSWKAFGADLFPTSRPQSRRDLHPSEPGSSRRVTE